MKLIAGNWKMNHGLAETDAFFNALKTQWASALGTGTQKELQSGGSLQACLIPPMLSLSVALRDVHPLPVAIGAQNAHWEKKGAFTGEVSGPMLTELGIKTVLVGHSERRQFFGETDETARLRTESLLAQGFRVILCIGETRAEREANRTRDVVLRQLSAVVTAKGVGAASFLGHGAAEGPTGRLVIAYEPVWAIGTGLTATPEQAEECHALIRTHLEEKFGLPAARGTPILYGGSVTPENIDSLLACPNVDGALVGGASLKPDSFLKLLEAGGRAIQESL